MKRIILLGFSIVLVAVGVWFGRAAWRAHQNIVTLNVRNMPLKDVVRKMEWQTWKKILVDKRLSGNVTLRLKNVPLAQALDRLAGQISATAQTIHAVHRSNYALKRLQTALVDGEEIASVDWINLAPREAFGGMMAGPDGKVITSDGSALPPEMSQQMSNAMANAMSKAMSKAMSNAMQQALQGGSGQMKLSTNFASISATDMNSNGGDLADMIKKTLTNHTAGVMVGSPQIRVMMLGPDGKLTTSDGSTLSPEMNQQISNAMQQALQGGGGSNFVSSRQMFSSPNVIVRKRNHDGTLETVDPAILAPERIVIEDVLADKLDNNLPAQPTRAAAEQSARKLKAHCTTLYALEKSDVSDMRIRRLNAGLLPSGLSTNSISPATIADQLAQRMRQEHAEQYEQLTPEERALRVRDERGFTNAVNTNQ